MYSVNVPETPNRQVITQTKNVHLPSEVLYSDWLLWLKT
jgi:hypothetical protein